MADHLVKRDPVSDGWKKKNLDWDEMEGYSVDPNKKQGHSTRKNDA